MSREKILGHSHRDIGRAHPPFRPDLNLSTQQKTCATMPPLLHGLAHRHTSKLLCVEKLHKARSSRIDMHAHTINHAICTTNGGINNIQSDHSPSLRSMSKPQGTHAWSPSTPSKSEAAGKRSQVAGARHKEGSSRDRGRGRPAGVGARQHELRLVQVRPEANVVEQSALGNTSYGPFKSEQKPMMSSSNGHNGKVNLLFPPALFRPPSLSFPANTRVATFVRLGAR